MRILVIFDTTTSKAVIALPCDMNNAVVKAFDYAMKEDYQVVKMCYGDTCSYIDYKYKTWEGEEEEESGTLIINSTELEI